MRCTRGLCTAVTLGAWLVCALCTPAHAEGPLVIGPYVQDLRAGGFVVAYETATDAATEVVARAADREGSSARSRGMRHEVAVAGFQPGDLVRYRVLVDGADAGGGEVMLPRGGADLDFVVMGDTRDGLAETAIAAAAGTLHPTLILHTGDLVRRGDDVQAWHAFFNAEAALLADVPLYPAAGNHELYRDPGGSRFQRYFVLPDDGRVRRYYRFDVGPARFVVLDGNAVTPAETAWLAAELDAADAAHVPHLFALVHQPALSLGEHCGAAREQAPWMDLFERHRVRAVFAGHDHAYARMERNGVRYFVSGGGGAMLYPEHECHDFDRAARRLYLPVHHLVRVRVRGPEVEIAALPVDGAGALGEPLDVVHARGGEPLFAGDGPPLVAASIARGRGLGLAAGAIALLALVLLGSRWRRRQAATR